MLTDWDGKPLSRGPDTLTAGVSAVITDEDCRVLLQFRSDNGRWGIPGGAIEVGESIAEAIEREVREETGLDIEIVRLVGVYSDPRQFSIATYPGGDIVHLVNICMLCRPKPGGELRGSDEGREVRFFAFDDLPDPLLRAHRIRILDALSDRREALIR